MERLVSAGGHAAPAPAIPFRDMDRAVVKILNVVGARPNFMKIAPIVEALQRRPGAFDQRLVHTGQHYDERMSLTFFRELGLPRPDIDLGVGSGSHAEQTGRIMIEFERVCRDERPDLVIVVGDVNSTLACAITAKKLGIRVAHVEAGLRSGDMSMPEEINRLCTDALCDYLFTTDAGADANLRREGVAEYRIHRVGNVMIDTLLKHRALAADRPLLQSWGVTPQRYALLTLHRPSNVDEPEVLAGIIAALECIAEDLPIVFPLHPRTRGCAEQFGLSRRFSAGLPVRGLWVTEPLGYLDFLHLTMHARLVLTDSGGLQEETTVLGVPCVTLRHNTERPITCTEGTNRLAGTEPEAIVAACRDALATPVSGRIPELWDGQAGERIAAVLARA